MGRPVMLGNGSLTVGLDETGLVHDFYYPYVGLDNLTTARSSEHRIGVWVDGVFSWVGTDEWEVAVDFEVDALIGHVTFTNQKLQLSIKTVDFVDHQYNTFYRRVAVKNLGAVERTIRLFMHQVFEISRGGRGDTALYVPDDNYVLDYKGRCALLIYAQDDKGAGFDQFSVGNYGIEGKTGTYVDAEDGNLSNNPVEHGSVDSVVRLSLELASGQETPIDYWIVAADSQYDAEKIHRHIKDEGLERRLSDTRNYWYQWLDTSRSGLQNVPDHQRVAIKKSLMVIKAHTDARGGIIASCDSSIYNYGRDYYSYVWPRDGAYAMWPLIRLGYTDEPKKFFEFCRDTISDEGYLAHKYQPDRAIGSTWHPLLHNNHRERAIQEDETAIVLYMLSEYFETSGDREFVEGLYRTFLQPAANFLADFRDPATHLPHASYDLWEEKFLTSTYTTAVVHRALLSAADMADVFAFPDDAVHWRSAAEEIAASCHVLFDEKRGAFRKGYLLQDDGSLEFDNTLDVSSAYGPLMFASKAFGSQAIRSTFKAIETELSDTSPSGGVPRYEHDTYFAHDDHHLGNPWFVTSLWMAQYYLQLARNPDAEAIIDWTLAHALPSGVLSEQLAAADGTPLSVAPLVWSHAELINTLLDLQQ